MCEARVFYRDDGGQRQIMDDVVLVQPDDGVYLVVNVLGEQKLVQGRIEKIDFLHRKIYFGPTEDRASLND